ncbi:MAG TPA: hypothetical protein VHS56_14340 [Candidatus Cybelea sp.]|jgi:hypothetical protein|nr:hypothetical protein [Candidatus Cybelea sp.]
MRTAATSRPAFRTLFPPAICAAIVLAATLPIERSTLELTLLHAVALTPIIAVLGWVA